MFFVLIFIGKVFVFQKKRNNYLFPFDFIARVQTCVHPDGQFRRQMEQGKKSKIYYEYQSFPHQFVKNNSIESVKIIFEKLQLTALRKI